MLNYNKLQISAVIVSKNEGRLLEMCLPSVNFCKQIIVVDLNSTDNTRKVARKNKAEVWQHDPVPVVEIIHEWIQDKVNYAWILITDPDEVISNDLANQIISIFQDFDEAIGSVRVPWIFYFKNHRLNGTPWGGVNSRILLVNNERFRFTSEVHRGRNLLPEYKEYKISFTGKNCIHHYWMISYLQLIKKHLRYLKAEGKSKYLSNERTSLKQLIKIPKKEFIYSYIKQKGYKDGIRGFFLSLFWAWYQVMAQWCLYKYQKKVENS